MAEPIKHYFFEDLHVGQRETLTKKITLEDVKAFADLSGDHNPLHVDEDYAKTTIFGERIAHGFYTASFISALLGYYLPGPGSIYLGQTLSFKAPVKLGDTVVALVEVSELVEKGFRAKFRCEIKVGDKVCAEGEALIKVPSRNPPPPKA